MDIEKRRVYAIVDFDALDQNVQAMEEKLPQDVGMMAVIKTNAYGHGAKAIAKHLEDNDRISGYAVATAEEALELRKAGIGKMILILGYVFEKDYEDLILQDIRFGIYRKDMAQALDAAAEKCHKKALIHIQNMEPAPPTDIAAATPAMFPTPSVPDKAIQAALKGDILPPFLLNNDLTTAIG